MNFLDFEIGSNAYKLRLNTKNVIDLEKRIGCNPLSIFGDGSTIPTVSTMVAVLHASLQQYQHGITTEKACDIFDEYLADGHSMADFIPTILEIYKVSGLVGEESAEKN
jgi:hypothetical protein